MIEWYARAREGRFGDGLVDTVGGLRGAGGWYRGLGTALLQLGRAPEAVVAMRRSVRLRPGHASWFENLAVAEGAAGYAQAEQQAREMASRLRAEGSRAA